VYLYSCYSCHRYYFCYSITLVASVTGVTLSQREGSDRAVSQREGSDRAVIRIFPNMPLIIKELLDLSDRVTGVTK